MQEWEIKDKVTAIVTNNASNIKLAVTNSEVTNVTCFAHSLQLCLHAGFNHIKSLVVIFLL